MENERGSVCAILCRIHTRTKQEGEKVCSREKHHFPLNVMFRDKIFNGRNILTRIPLVVNTYA